mmetsp:Transcript_16345/g.23052  ORF Transcript_16345/g.23052 Transcript_16345/m.23052 type:complete len:345 (+) Transcript_16345:136-1170(+)
MPTDRQSIIMAKQKQYFVIGFLLGFGVGFLTRILQFPMTQEWENPLDGFLYSENTSLKQALLDPFPLSPCAWNRTSAVYVFYGRSVQGNSLFASIQSLMHSNFPGRVRLIIDQKVNETIRSDIDEEYRYLLDKIDLFVVPLPDLAGKELIPHSNKIRALQAGALVYGTDNSECTICLDDDTKVHPNAPWEQLLSTLQMNDVSVAHDCLVTIEGVPEFLRTFMPNTGVLALRNTPRTRMVLRDWLDHFQPCNGTHAETCTPGTDQYPFLQLLAKHGARFWKLDQAWNCRITPSEMEHGIQDFPVHSLTVLSNRRMPMEDNASLVTTCSGYRECHILHGHWLKYSN